MTANRPIVEEIAVRLDAMPGRQQVKALVDLTYAGLRVKDIRIIETLHGDLRICFPDRPQTAPCVGCDMLVSITGRFCHSCGARQPWREAPRNAKGFGRPTRAVVHPISHDARLAFETPILEAYEAALDARDAARRAAG